MDTKLTLKLDKVVIEKAKRYASSHSRSLSSLVESYLESITSGEPKTNADEPEISPFVKSMASGVSIPADLDYKAEYAKRLQEK